MAAETVRIVCPVCAARLTVDPTTSAARIQCSRCLNTIDMKTAAVESSGAGVTVVPAPEAVREPAPGACAEGGEAAARLVQIAAERDELKRRLVNAESMLAEAGQALDRFRELERRVDAMGAAYLQALARVRELEGR